MQRVNFTTRVNAVDKERWQSVVKLYPGKAYELFTLAMDWLEQMQEGAQESLPPMQRAQSAIITLGNALGDIAAEMEKTEALKNRIKDLETFIAASERKQAEREAELLGNIHRLREERDDLKKVHLELEKLRGKYDAVLQDRTNLRKKLRKIEDIP